MKTKNNDNEVVTRGILREAFDEFAEKIETNIVERIEAKIDAKIDQSIGDLAIMVEKGFVALHEEIRGEIRTADTGKDVTELKIRVGKLEKKAR